MSSTLLFLAVVLILRGLVAVANRIAMAPHSEFRAKKAFRPASEMGEPEFIGQEQAP